MLSRLQINLGIFMAFILLIGSYSFAQSGSQQAFEQGYQAYMRNQFPIAESHLEELYKLRQQTKIRLLF